MVALSANTNRHTLLTLLTNACLLSQQMSATMCTVSLLQATAGCAGRVWHLISGMRGAFRIRCYGHFGFGLQQSHTSHSHTRKAHERPSSDSLTPTLSHLLRFSADLRSSAPALAFALPAPFGAGLVNSSPCAKHRESQSPTGLQRLEDFPLLHMFCCLRGLEFRLPLATGINLNLDSGWNGCPQKRSRRLCQEGDTRHGLLLYIFFRRGMKWQEGCQRPDPAS